MQTLLQRNFSSSLLFGRHVLQNSSAQSSKGSLNKRQKKQNRKNRKKEHSRSSHLGSSAFSCARSFNLQRWTLLFSEDRPMSPEFGFFSQVTASSLRTGVRRPQSTTTNSRRTPSVPLSRTLSVVRGVRGNLNAATLGRALDSLSKEDQEGRQAALLRAKKSQASHESPNLSRPRRSSSSVLARGCRQRRQVLKTTVFRVQRQSELEEGGTAVGALGRRSCLHHTQTSKRRALAFRRACASWRPI